MFKLFKSSLGTNIVVYVVVYTHTNKRGELIKGTGPGNVRRLVEAFGDEGFYVVE